MKSKYSAPNDSKHSLTAICFLNIRLIKFPLTRHSIVHYDGPQADQTVCVWFVCRCDRRSHVTVRWMRTDGGEERAPPPTRIPNYTASHPSTHPHISTTIRISNLPRCVCAVRNNPTPNVSHTFRAHTKFRSCHKNMEDASKRNKGANVFWPVVGDDLNTG